MNIVWCKVLVGKEKNIAEIKFFAKDMIEKKT